MSIGTWKLGMAFAALNAAVFAVMLAVRSPQYEVLRMNDQRLRETDTFDLNSANPIYMAGRPFYSPAHYSDVPWWEPTYFRLNTPGMLAALTLEDPASAANHESWVGLEQTSSAWRSWKLAVIFAVCSTLWAFVIGAAVGWFVRAWSSTRLRRRL